MAVKHFYEQVEHTRNYLLPYFYKHIPNLVQCKVLEIGCAEGGFLQPLQELGMDVRGIELSAERVAIALQHAPQLKVQVGDITDPEISGRINAQFNLIVMRDVIEHVPQREITFKNLKNLLKQGGYLYITFPPKFSAYGGHQQNARSPIKYIPFFQLLPESTIRKTGYWLKEKPQTIEQILHIYSIGLTIDEFEKHCVQSGLAMKTKELFLSRPIFKTRFGVPVIRFPNLLYVREFLSCGCEYLLQKK